VKLIDDSFTPIPGTRIGMGTQELWKKESDRLKDAVLKQNKAPFVDKCRKWLFTDMLRTLVYSDIK